MIAYAGMERLRAGENDSGRIEMSPRSALPAVTRKGKGKRRVIAA
jgi:hypothetical protein